MSKTHLLETPHLRGKLGDEHGSILRWVSYSTTSHFPKNLTLKNLQPKIKNETKGEFVVFQPPILNTDPYGSKVKIIISCVSVMGKVLTLYR